MPEITLKQLFPEPWGIVQSRREEIERGGAGSFDRALKEEIQKHFINIEQIATAMECHKNTAGKRLRNFDPRYFFQDQKTLYYRPDIDTIIAELKKQAEAKAQAALKEKLERKRRPRKITGKSVDEMYNAMRGKKYAPVS